MSTESLINLPTFNGFPFHFIIQVTMWYLFSVLFNIELKQFFNQYNAPFFITFFNLFVSCLASAGCMGKTQVVEMDMKSMMKKLFLVGLLQFVGTLSTNLSISAMAVSFTHIIKAIEPVFTIAWIAGLSWYGFLSQKGRITSKSQLFAVCVVMIGVVMASISESTYSHFGLLFGLLSSIMIHH